MEVAIANVLADCQRTTAAHRRASVTLLKLWRRAGADDGEFTDAFLAATDRVLAVYKREPAVERVATFLIDFVAGVANAPSARPARNPGADDDEEEDEPAADPGSAFLANFFKHLLKFSNAKDKAPRLRVCQLIAGVMEKLGEEAELDDELYEQLQECLLVRLRDKVPAVRVQGVKSLLRLQDPGDESDAVTQEFARMLATDSNKDVRMTVLPNIALTRATLPVILERTRDIKPEVRSLTFNTLSKMLPQQLSMSQRTSLLQDGLNDRDATVQAACVNLVCVWLAHRGYNISNLLRLIDVTVQEKLGETLLQRLFSEIAALFNNSDVDYETTENLRRALHWDIPTKASDLSVEDALFWRVRCEWLKSQTPSRLDDLEDMLPDMMAFCDLLSDTTDDGATAGDDDDDAAADDEDDRWFVRRQLFALARHIDFADEAGRRELVNRLLGLLTSLKVDDELVEPMLRVLAAIQGNESGYVRCVVQVVNDVKDPLDDSESRSATLEALREVRAAKEDAHQRLTRAVAAEEFEEAAGLKAALKGLAEKEVEIASHIDEESDLCRWLRCLTITKCLFQFTAKPLSMPELSNVFTSVVLPAVASEHPAVRHEGLACLSLCALIESELVAAHMPLLLQALDSDLPVIQRACARGVADLLALYSRDTFTVSTPTESAGDAGSGAGAGAGVGAGAEGVESGAAGAPTTNLYQAGVAALLAKATSPTGACDAVVRQVAAEGLAKLLLLNRVADAEVVAGLLRLYFLPPPVEGVDEAEVDGEDEELAETMAMERLEAAARTQQCLAVFWSAFALASTAHQELLASAAMPALQALMADMVAAPENATKRRGKATTPRLSPKQLDVFERAVQYTIFLLSDASGPVATSGDAADAGADAADDEESKAAPNFHSGLVVPLLAEVAAAPTGPFVRVLCKGVASLQVDLSPAASSAVASLITDCEETITDKPALRTLSKAKPLFEAAAAGAPKDAVTEAVAAAQSVVETRFDALESMRTSAPTKPKSSKKTKSTKASRDAERRVSGGRRKLRPSTSSYVSAVSEESDDDDAASRRLSTSSVRRIRRGKPTRESRRDRLSAGSAASAESQESQGSAFTARASDDDSDSEFTADE